LAADSTVLWGEIIAPGREKRGEIFDYQSFRSNFKIFVEGELIAFDALHFSPRELELGSVGVLEDALYIGSIWLVSPKINDVDIHALQETLLVDEGLKASMTRLEGNAIHCRWLGRSQWALQEEMKRIYALLAKMV